MKKKQILFFILTAVLFTNCKLDEPGMNPTAAPIAGDLTQIPAAPHNFTVEVPQGFPAVEVPADNPMTREGVELGRHLFYDVRLSKGDKMSCGSCHLPQKGFADPARFSVGVNGQVTDRQSMALMNIGMAQTTFFWDGRAASLEAQALEPVENHIELDENWGNVIAKLQKDTMYHRLFRKAFAIRNVADITKELAVKAIAQFERTIIVGGESRYQKVFVKGTALYTDEELDGYDMFFNTRNSPLPDAQCLHCHNEPLFKSGTGGTQFTNNGLQFVTSLDDFADKGRGRVTGIRFDNGKFRAPTLWNNALSAPYMHNGRLRELKHVVDFYADAPKSGENLDPFVERIVLDEPQKDAIVAFMKMLTDTVSLRKPEFQNPFR
jgi:cytochrome c peroxidase